MNLIIDKLEEARKELDEFNLLVAKHRVLYGMSLGLKELYKDMGILDESLRMDLSGARAIANKFQHFEEVKGGKK